MTYLALLAVSIYLAWPHWNGWSCLAGLLIGVVVGQCSMKVKRIDDGKHGVKIRVKRGENS